MKKIIFYIVMLALVWAVVEGCLFGASLVLKKRGVRYVEQTSDDFEIYMKRRDPDLGWPPKDPDSRVYDSTGARINPFYPQTAESCISAYGDSFTFSAEVEAKDAWTTVLSTMLNCRVSNFGVGGYGTDQSYLRYKRNEKDHSDIVILGHLSENVVRNVNRFRNLLRTGTRYGLKPRFIIGDDGELKLLPLPTFSKEEYRRLVKSPESVLDHEYFSRPSFPYIASALTGTESLYYRSMIYGSPWYAPFYDKNHPSGALKLTENIILAFVHLAKERAARPIVLILPTYEDFEYFGKKKTWVAQPLVDRLKDNDLEVIHAGPAMWSNLKGRDPAELFRLQHYNETGERLVAGIVYRWLEQH